METTLREGGKKMAEIKEWTSTVTDVDSVDWKGREITLRDVPAEQSGKEIRVRLDDIMKAEQQYLAGEYGLRPTHIRELLLLYAPGKFIKTGYIEQKFRFNKMLFHEWKKLEKNGYGDSYIFDEFVSARAGPVPVNLKEDLKGLEAQSFIKAKWAERPGESSKFELTQHGKEIAKSLWDNTPTNIRDTIIQTKEELFLVDAEQLKDRFHKEYPEYKKEYIEPDTE
ncbi:MAG: hypothetical protein Q8O41_10725 [Candidatus Methanoperedens sp.]|nr:hypothetical protein [Candidatus Methanoperedens sp.]